MPLTLRACLVVLFCVPLATAEGVSLKTQKVGKTTYFLVTVDPPEDLCLPSLWDFERGNGNDHLEDHFIRQPGEAARRAVMQMPRLVPQDEQTAGVYYAGQLGGKLTFLGKRTGSKSTATFQLVYPVKSESKGFAGLPGDRVVQKVRHMIQWQKAEPVAVPLRQPRASWVTPAVDDLQARHAWAQAQHFARLELRAPQAGLFGVARTLTGSNYSVWSAPLARAGANQSEGRDPINSDAQSLALYTLFSGAAHLDEAVHLRCLSKENLTSSARTISLDRLPKVTLAEHDWKKMMGDKKPAKEPLARWTPQDCYYLTVNSIATFESAWEVLSTWGGSLLRLPQISDRDYDLRARYERQLALPVAQLQAALGADGLRSAALVGSDLSFIEGTDVTVLFEARDANKFRVALGKVLEDVVRPLGDAVKTGSEKYQGVVISSWSTARREVSAYRATVGNVFVCSNSPVAIRRVLDAQAKRETSLAEALDFQYMRTVFRRDAKSEDGFVFLSDAFIRRLVSAATRIKAMRRQQARVALGLASHAALFVALESGRFSEDTRALRQESGLSHKALADPDGDPVAWDGKARQAHSAFYGTLEFSTPLVEIPIDRVSNEEALAYQQFHRAYMQAWTNFFDPVGLRFKLRPDKTEVEIYILPLINSSEYNWVRNLTQGGFLRFDPSSVARDTVFQVLLHTKLPATGEEGDWLMTHLSSQGLKAESLARWAIQQELRPGTTQASGAAYVLSSRLIVGVSVSKNAEQGMKELHDLWERHLKPDNGKVVESKYRSSVIRKADCKPQTMDGLYELLRVYLPLLSSFPRGPINKDAIYVTPPGKELVFSFNEQALKDRIDHTIRLKDARPGKVQKVHAALHVAPPRGDAGKVLSAYLDWRSHVQTQSALAVWETLYTSGLVSPEMKPVERNAAARRLLGYAPVSVDGALRWNASDRSMSSDHHGSLAAPRYRGKLATDSPLGKLLREVRSVQAGVRFREDGIHTTLTIDGKLGQ